MNIIKLIATHGPTGYIRGGGTIASLQTALLIWLFAPRDTISYASLIIVLCISSFFIINRSVAFFEQKDPSQIVLDESMGCMIASLGFVSSVYSLFAALVLFRLFDIVKPGVISSTEKLPGAWGILGDDCVAGIITNLIMKSIIFVIS